VSGSKRNAIIVSRNYRPEPDYCTHALALLLEKTVREVAAEDAPEPGGRDDDAKEVERRPLCQKKVTQS
jgi:hypothetical protein